MTLASGWMESVFAADVTAAWYVLERKIGTGIDMVLELFLLEPD